MYSMPHHFNVKAQAGDSIFHQELELQQSQLYRLWDRPQAPYRQRRPQPTYSPTESRSPRSCRMVRMAALSEEPCNENTDNDLKKGLKRKEVV